MIAVQALKDDSGHWYLVPNEYAKAFRVLHEKATDDNYEAQKEFEERFSKFMTGGDLNNTQLFIDGI